MHVRSWRTRTPPPSAVLIVLVCGYGDVGRVYAYSSWFVLCVLCRLRCIRQCHVHGWYCWYFSPCGRGVSFVVVRPLMLRIKAGMYQKDSDAGLVLLSALCFLLLSSDPDVRHLGRYGPEGQVCSTGVWPRSSNAAVAYLTGFAGDDIYSVSRYCRQDRDDWHLGRNGPEGLFAFSCCSHVHCVQRQVPGGPECKKLRIFHSFCSSTRSSTSLTWRPGGSKWSR